MTECDWTAKSDVELMEGVVARHQRALECLIERFIPAVFGVSCRMLGTGFEAEEVTSDVFVQIWDHPDRYDSTRARPQAYILMLTRSRCLDRLRTKTRERARQQPATLSEVPEPTEELADVYLGELSTIVKTAMRALPECQRQAIQLAFFEGLSHSEIASKLGTPLGSVKSHIRRGLLKLRASVSPHVEGDQ